MTFVPRIPNPKTAPRAYVAPPAPTITVHALKENARPIGFAPWPDPQVEPETDAEETP